MVLFFVVFPEISPNISSWKIGNFPISSLMNFLCTQPVVSQKRLSWKSPAQNTAASANHFSPFLLAKIHPSMARFMKVLTKIMPFPLVQFGRVSRTKIVVYTSLPSAGFRYLAVTKFSHMCSDFTRKLVSWVCGQFSSLPGTFMDPATGQEPLFSQQRNRNGLFLVVIRLSIFNFPYALHPNRLILCRFCRDTFHVTVKCAMVEISLQSFRDFRKPGTARTQFLKFLFLLP